MLLPDWEQRAETHGGYMDPGAPSMFLLHTMEGYMETSMASLSARGNWPHFCYEPSTRRRVQGVDTQYAAKSLADKAGGVQTNSWGCVQIELQGFAAEAPDWPDEYLHNIAEDVFAPLHRLGYFDLVAPAFLGPESGAIAAENAPQRFTYEAWYGFHGVCGHQHAPEQWDRWDPGRLNVPRIFEITAQLLAPPGTTKGSTMNQLVRYGDTWIQFAVDAAGVLGQSTYKPDLTLLDDGAGHYYQDIPILKGLAPFADVDVEVISAFGVIMIGTQNANGKNSALKFVPSAGWHDAFGKKLPPV